MVTKTKVHVFVNRKKLELDVEELTREQLMERAGFPSAGHDLFRLKGEGDPSGGVLIGAGELIHLKNGEHFRIVPGNLTFGA